MSELLGILSAAIGLVATGVPIFRGIRTRNPAKRSYWEREVQERLGPDKEWPSDERLRKRAEIALAYVDADEAIRRVGGAGAASTWFLGGVFYFLAVFLRFQADHVPAEFKDAADAWQWSWTIAAGLSVVAGVITFAVASSESVRRQELQRVLVEVSALPGGAEAVAVRPESLVTAWRERKIRKRLQQNTKTRKVTDPGRLYQEWAKGLLDHYENLGTKTLANRSGKGRKR